MMDMVGRGLAGVCGVALMSGGVYLLVAGAKTAGIGLFGSFFGFFGLCSLVVGVVFMVIAMKRKS